MALPRRTQVPRRPLPQLRGWTRKFSSFLRFQRYRPDEVAVSSVIVALDGSGDFDDIQAAIDSLPDTGGRIIVKQGTFVIPSKITLTKSNVTITGSGRASIIQATTHIQCLEVSNASHVIIQNLYFVSSAGFIGLEALKFSECTNCTARNNFFDTSSVGSIDFAHASPTTTHNVAENNTIEESGPVAIKAVNENYVSIRNNVFSGTFSTSAISCTGDSGVISGNQILSNAPIGIHCDTVTNFLISNNHIENAEEDGISFTADSDNNTISSNEITSCKDGIELNQSDNNVISHNNIHDNTGWGINILSVAPVSDSTIITNNSLLNNIFGPLVDNGTNTQIGHNTTDQPIS